MEEDPRRDWSAVYDALSHDVRRGVVRRLAGEGPAPVSTESLAEAVADGPGVDGEPEVELRHLHLPKLADAGLIRWERGDGAVVATPFVRELPAALYRPATVLGAAFETAGRADD